MHKDIIKKAFAEAEKEQQEKEINKIKSVVKDYLKEIQEKTEEKNKLETDIKLLKKDLDDLKSGRLDKIEDRQHTDSHARDISLIIVERIQKEYIPMYPWQSPFVITVKQPPTWTTGAGTFGSNVGYITTTASSGDYTNSAMTLTGTTLCNFVGGSYDINGKIVNL